jgi:hypothetical protein
MSPRHHAVDQPNVNAKALHARIEKCDLELSISDGRRLSDQLIEPRCGHRAEDVSELFLSDATVGFHHHYGEKRLCHGRLTTSSY